MGQSFPTRTAFSPSVAFPAYREPQLKNTFAGAGFEIDLDVEWRRVVDQFVEEDEACFVHDGLDTRLFIGGDLISAEGQDLRALAVSANEAVRGSAAQTLARFGDTLLFEAAPLVQEEARGVDIIAVGKVDAADAVEHMLIITILHRYVLIYARLRSQTQGPDALLALWKTLRADLFLAEAS